MRGIWLPLFSSIAFLNGFVSAQQLPHASANRHGTLYLAGFHQLAAVDLRTGTVKVWALLTLAGLKESADCSAYNPPVSCDWSVSQVRFNLKNGRIYFVAPADGPGNGSVSVDDFEGAVWVLKLRHLEIAKKLDLPASREQPTILTGPNGRRLFVGYTTADSGQPIVDIFDTTNFREISRVKDSSGDVLNTYFPAGSYFLPSGKMIVVDDSRIRVEPGQFKREYVDHRSHLPAAERDKLRDFFTTEKDGRRFLKSRPIWSLNGRTLESVQNESQTAFWTVDMATGATSPAVIVSFSAKAALIGTGSQFAVFGADLLPATAEHSAYFSYTGRVAIYDVKSGALTGKFQMDELKGKGQMLCSSEDGSIAAYARGDELMILDLQTGRVTRIARELHDLPQPGYSGECAFLSE